MRVTEALAEGRARLAQTESASLDAALLLSHVLGVGREKLYLDSAELSAEDLSRFRQCLERRRSGECTAYITGRREFYGLEFRVTPAVLVPRPDTETLVEAALEELSAFPPSCSLSLLDLCTGSGAVAVALKHEKPELEVWAADISGEALEIARLNAERLLSGRENAGIRFFHGDLYGDLPGGPLSGGPLSDGRPSDTPKFAIITANAPYVPSAGISGLSKEVQNEPRIALDGGEDGLDLIRRIIEGAPRYLVRAPETAPTNKAADEAASGPDANPAGRTAYGGVLLLEAD
ncbi:MAG: peptide chain release factor N(5)-glutamine methyltransferase, partial [Treponema sp.]|nr:peptide chain release factor N(5)-glutamine methyltransferase [Treponema sp.]